MDKFRYRIGTGTENNVISTLFSVREENYTIERCFLYIYLCVPNPMEIVLGRPRFRFVFNCQSTAQWDFILEQAYGTVCTTRTEHAQADVKYIIFSDNDEHCLLPVWYSCDFGGI